MVEYNVHTRDHVVEELRIIWAAHMAVGLEGKMCLYTAPTQDPWRSQEGGVKFWFGPEDVRAAANHLDRLYNGGLLPNSSMLLNPMVHQINETGSYEPVGSGIFWATCPAPGIQKVTPDMAWRIKEMGLFSNYFHRAENLQAGLKIIGFSKTALPPMPDNVTVPGNHELF